MAILEWALWKGCPVDGRTMCIQAATNGHLEILNWLHKERMLVYGYGDCNALICYQAATHGYLEILK